MSSRRSLYQRLLAILFTLGLVVTLEGCERLQSVESLYRDAEARYLKGEQKAAVIQLKVALQKDPKHGPSRLLSAKAYNDIGDFASAEKEAQKSLELGVNADQANLELARALFGQGQYQKTLDLAKITPNLTGEALAKVLTMRGDAQIGLNQLAPAKESYAAAIQAAPAYFGGYLGQTRVALANNDIVEAMRQVELALKNAPQSAEAYTVKGDLLAAQNKNELAIEAYQSAAKANLNRAIPYFRIANAYLALNKPEEVVKAVQAGQKIDPDTLEGHLLLARNDFQQKKYNEARAHIQTVLRSAPDHLPSILLSGVISVALGESELAEKNLKRVINKLPNNNYARALLATNYLNKGQADQALEVLAPALEGENPDERSLAVAGQAYLAKGDTARATSMFEKARIANPENAAIRAQLGAARLAGGGDNKQAIADLEAASAMDKQQVNADMVLIMSFLQQKEFDKALAAVDVLEKKQPDSPIPSNLRGGVNLSKGDIKTARANFELALSKRGDFFPAAQNLVQLDLREKNIPAARKRYEGVLATDKQNSGAMIGLAQLALLEKNENAYAEWLKKALAAKPDAFEARGLLVEYYLRQKQPKDALRLAAEAQSAKPEDARALELLARVQFAAGDKESGLQSYKKLVQQNPKSPTAHYGLGLAEAGLNQTEGARSAFQKALQLQPAYYEAAVALIALEARQERMADALKVAKDFQRANPKLAVGFTLEGDVYAQQRKYDAAIQAMTKAQTLQANGRVAIRLHQLYTLNKRQTEADNVLLQWLKTNPNDVAARLYLAESYQSRKLNKAAIEQYSLVQKAVPDQVMALNNLALLYQAEKDARALPSAEQAYKLKPDVAAVADTLGWILLEQGQTARAVEILRKAVTVAPEQAEIGYHYAVALSKSGDRAAARKQLETILAPGKAFPQQEQAKALLKQL